LAQLVQTGGLQVFFTDPVFKMHFFSPQTWLYIAQKSVNIIEKTDRGVQILKHMTSWSLAVPSSGKARLSNQVGVNILCQHPKLVKIECKLDHK
jgi:hypothetical protein